MVRIKHFEADSQEGLDRAIESFINSHLSLDNLMDIRFSQTEHKARIIYKDDVANDILNPKNRVLKSSTAPIRSDIDIHDSAGLPLDKNMTYEDAHTAKHNEQEETEDESVSRRRRVHIKK